jgi:hypothetical protein
MYMKAAALLDELTQGICTVGGVQFDGNADVVLLVLMFSVPPFEP